MISLLETAKRLKAMSDTGLLYSKDEYDRERYEELHAISENLISELSGQTIESLANYFKPTEEYPTPKIDIRGLVLNEKKEILLVKEAADGRLSLIHI